MFRRTIAFAVAATLAALGVQSAARAATPTALHISSHLPKTAKASLDGGKSVGAPGYGSVNVPTTAGHHVLTITTSTGVTYKTDLDFKPSVLMTWRHRGYWCVNLL
jgi:hypothetical protein